jgi:hypothetical protein
MASVNYNDKRFTQVESEKKVALNENEKMYNNMINSSDKYYDKQIDAVDKWGDKQAQLQQEQTDFAIEKIEQQKDYAHKDYLKEQSGAYVDWQKQSNQYGVNAERQAQNGLAFTGYSESSQVAMYNQYQNRVAVARESFNRALVDYDNMMKEARLQNNAKLAELAFQTLQKTLELSLQGFQYKNTLLIDKANKKAEINDRYYTRYQNVLQQINTENALAEQVRQYNEQMAEEKRQFNETMAFNRAKSFSSGGGGSSGGSSSGKRVKSSSSKESSSGSNKVKSGSGSKSLTIDMKSVTNLGYGPISASKLNELVASGQVIETEKNGVLTYKRATPKKTTSTKKSTTKKSSKKQSTFAKNVDYFNNLPSRVKERFGLG